MIFPKIYIQIERWRWNPKYNSYISNMGNIRNKKKELRAIRITKATGYSVCSACIDGNRKTFPVHRAVADTWCKCPKALNEPTVDHINMNKRDNRAINLEWVSVEENQLRAKESEEVVITRFEKTYDANKCKIAVNDWRAIYNNQEDYLIRNSTSNTFLPIKTQADLLRTKHPMEPRDGGYEKTIIQKALNGTMYAGAHWYLLRKEDEVLINER